MKNNKLDNFVTRYFSSEPCHCLKSSGRKREEKEKKSGLIIFSSVISSAFQRFSILFKTGSCRKRQCARPFIYISFLKLRDLGKASPCKKFASADTVTRLQVEERIRAICQQR